MTGERLQVKIDCSHATVASTVESHRRWEPFMHVFHQDTQAVRSGLSVQADRRGDVSGMKIDFGPREGEKCGKIFLCAKKKNIYNIKSVYVHIHIDKELFVCSGVLWCL